MMNNSRKGMEYTWVQIISFLVLLGLLIWVLFFYSGIKDKISELLSGFFKGF